MIESIIYLSFISFDLLKIDSTYLKYLGIVLCLIYVIYNKKSYKVIALSFTLIADLFLLVLNQNYELGVFIFIGAQISYLLYLRSINNKSFKTFLPIRIFIIIVGSIVLYLSKNNSLLNELVLIYFSSLVINCLNAYNAKEKMFTLGLLLFIACDICVGLHNTTFNTPLISILMWVFYLPSQVLIALS